MQCEEMIQRDSKQGNDPNKFHTMSTDQTQGRSQLDSDVKELICLLVLMNNHKRRRH